MRDLKGAPCIMDIYDDRICGLGEGPVWHPDRQELFWVDIPNRKIMGAGATTSYEHQFEEMVSALGIIDEAHFLLATESGLYRLKIFDWSTELIVGLEADLPDNRSNDGRADPWGGFWIGTMSKSAEKGAGSFYRYYKGELRKQVSDITVTNGLCFDKARSVGYFTDSAAKQTWRVPLDSNGWTCGSPASFLDFSADGTTVDGAIIDREGHMWCAIFDGAAVLRVSPDGKIVKRLDTQTPRATCPAFSGNDLSDIVVTTAAVGLDEAGEDTVPHGVTLRFANCARGVREPTVIV